MLAEAVGQRKTDNTMANKRRKGQTMQLPKDLVWFIVFNATFSNISAISWQPVLVVEEAGVPGKNYRPWTSNW